MVCCINSQQNHWGRYTTTDTKLHGPWSLADPAFAVVDNATAGSGGGDDPYGGVFLYEVFAPFYCDLKTISLPRQARDKYGQR